MFKKILLAVFLAAALPAAATDYSDIWWNPAESGWGVNLAQNGNFIFATFFVYGPAGTPTWYTAQLTQDSMGKFPGPLYATSGPWFGATQFDPAQVAIAQVGSATFQPMAADNALLSYDVDGQQVSKIIQRQTLAPTLVAGSYLGAIGLSLSSCSDPTKNHSGSLPASIGVAQSAGQTQLTLDFPGIVSCTFSGPATQVGQLVTYPAAYVCSNGFKATATVYELRATSLGIEGRWTAPHDGGCHEEGRFSALLQSQQVVTLEE